MHSGQGEVAMGSGQKAVTMGSWYGGGGHGRQATQQTRHVYSTVQHVLIWLKTGVKKILEFFSYLTTDNY